MIIRELKFCNFLLFKDEQELIFPSESETNVVLVLAPNNTGKTSVIRALKFLFYEHLSECGTSSAYRMIHDGTRAKTKVNGEAKGYVEAELELANEIFRVRRQIRSIKQGNDHWHPPEISFFKVVVDRGSNRLVPDSTGVYEQRIRTAVPESLFDAFYFKGEPLDGKLLGGVKGIRESLASFLHEDGWEEAEAAAEQVRTGFHQELSRLTANHTEYNRLIEEEEGVQRYIQKEKNQIGEKRGLLETAQAQFEEVTAQLEELGSGGDSERLVQVLRSSAEALTRIKRDREKIDLEIARLVGTSKGVPFLMGAIPIVRRLLREMQDDNILPADLSEPFVNRVLKSERCVCGRPHTAETRQSWERYREKTLSADVNHGLTALVNAVQDNAPQSYSRFVQEIGRTLSDLLGRRKNLLHEIPLLEEKHDHAEKQLRASPVEAIRSLTIRVRQLAQQRENLQREIRDLERNALSAENNLKNVQSKLQKAKPSGLNAQKEKALQRARHRAETLRALIRQSRELLNDAFYSILQHSVGEYYSAAYDGSRARISKASLLPGIEVNGQVQTNVGGAQSQLLALAYVVSLSRLRKNLHQQMVGLGVGLGKLDDQSFFLDSPFRDMTETYAHAIAQFLVGNGRQMVLLLARQQWDLAKPVLEKSICKTYAMKLSTLPEKVEELKEKGESHDFDYAFRGKKLKLLEALKEGAHPFTTLQEIL